jgi:uncharacterized damage-inducible protein DinB
MHPRLAAVVSYADAARAELLGAVDTIPEELREARPTESQWSAAEVLEHLVRVETGVAKLMALKIGEMQAAPEPPREAPEMVEVVASRFELVVNRTQAIEAPDRVVPEGEMSADAARDALQATRGLLLDQLHAGDGLAFSSVVHPHPFLGALDLYEWVYFLGAHERRHAEQVRAIATQFAATES